MTSATLTEESPPPPAPGGTVRWTRLAALGLLLAGLGPLLMFVAGLVWGMDMGDEGPFLLITTAIALVGAFLVWRFGRWSKIAGIIAAVLVAGALFWTAFGLFTPNSFFDFVPGVLVIPGAFLAIGSCIGALVAAKRGHVTARAERGERRGIQIALTVVIVLTALSGALTLLGRSSVAEAGAALTVEQKDFEFDQREYSVAGGSQVLVRNNDPFLHTFTIDDLDIDVALTPGAEKLVDIPADAGSYVLYCKPHTGDPESPADDDMGATLTVE